MSSIRDPAIITNVGRKMMTAGGDITYTKAVLYGQDISHLTKDQLEGLTSVGDPLVTVPVVSATRAIMTMEQRQYLKQHSKILV